MKNIIAITIGLNLFCLMFAPLCVNAQYFNSRGDYLARNKLVQQIPFVENKLARPSSNFDNFEYLISKAQGNKTVSVIVGLDLNTTPEGYLLSSQKIVQRKKIKSIQNDLISQIAPADVKVLTRFNYIPFVALEVNENALKTIRDSPLVANIAEERSYESQLAESVPLIGGVRAWNQGYSGQGQVIAILDTGVDKYHNFLADKVVSEACYSKMDVEGVFENFCGGPTERTDNDSGLPCPELGCVHGTHVAGIAAGNGTNLGHASGVAKDARLISIQVFSGQISGAGVVVKAFDPQIIQGLERVLYLKNNTALNIASVNISIGSGGTYTTPCGFGGAMQSAIQNLKSVGIATVIASGNGNSTTGISYPGCVEGAVSVGATSDGSGGTGVPTLSADAIWSYPTIGNQGSNSADFLDLFAPGAVITSSFPGNTYGDDFGTSMAAPHVAGAWGVIKQRFPNASVDKILNALKVTGTVITDTRSGAGSRQKPRINVDLALDFLKHQARFDFNFDGKTDPSVFRASTGVWYSRKPDGSYNSATFGVSTDKLVPADFTGDGKTDYAVWRPSTGVWYILRSEDGSFYSVPFGTTNDIPAPGDFDGDGKADLAVYRPSEGNWYISKSSGGSSVINFGIAEDKPVVSDYDGDGKDDIGIFRPSVSEWWILKSQNNTTINVQFGAGGDKTVQGDYTGDGKSDVAVYRPSTGYWYILRSEDQTYYSLPFGTSTDIPVTGDYDGDGKTDVAIFRPSENNWYISGSTSGLQVIPFGTTGDVPVPNAYSVP